MPIVPFREGSFNPPNTHPKKQTAVMVIGTLEVEPLDVIPPTGGQLGATLPRSSSHPHATSWSLTPRRDPQDEIIATYI
jgi:hypothetical protein